MPTNGPDILIVASWFPSISDPVAGRFVADQAAALVAAGCRVRVVSFDPADLFGSSSFRGRLARNVEDIARGRLASPDLAFSPGGSNSAADIPIARLPIPNGRTPRDPILHGERHRTAALSWLVSRWANGRVDPDGFRPALIHAHTGYPDGVAAGALSDALGVPLIITEHSSFLARQLAIPDVRLAYAQGVSRASALIAVSNFFASEVREALPDVAERVHVIANTVDVDSFQPAQPGERSAGELLFVGYLRDTKGIDVLLKALKIVRDTRSDVSLRLIGDSGDPVADRRWHSLASELGVGDAVTWEHAMDREGVADAMRRADIFVHASRRETFGVVAAEALSAGLPVVASDSGGVPEILGRAEDGLGLVVPRDDPAAFAGAVLEILEHRTMYDQARLRASVVERFGSAAVARRLMDLYDATLNDGPQRADPPPKTADPLQIVDDPVVVVAFDPDRAQVLQALRPAVRARIILVTSRAKDHAVPSGFQAVALADLHDRIRALADSEVIGPRAKGWRRYVRLVRHPLAVARRRGLLPGLEAAITGPGSAAIRGALLGVARSGDAVPLLVCADGVDYLAARSIVDAGLAIPAPGGLRWLGDQLAQD